MCIAEKHSRAWLCARSQILEHEFGEVFSHCAVKGIPVLCNLEVVFSLVGERRHQDKGVFVVPDFHFFSPTPVYLS